MQPVERGVFWHRQLAFLNADRGCARCCIEGVNFDNISIRFVWRSRKRAGADIFLSSLRLIQWATCAVDMSKPLWWPWPHRGSSVSSITNVVTTGSVTSSLMKRVRFTQERVSAVQVAWSTNGQLTPPVIGAAAFLISEFTDVSYLELIKHAFLPTVISYVALIFIVHLEALKLGLKGLPRTSVAGSLLQN